MDALANRTAHSNTGSGAWTYDKNNQLLSRPNESGTGTVNYEYDANGNQVKKAEGAKVTAFVYDGDNRLIEVRDASAGANNLVSRYGYDPLNRRTWKEQYRDQAGNSLAQAMRTYYLYSDEGLIAEATQAITLGADQSVGASDPPMLTTQYGPRPNSEFTTGTLFVKTKNSNGEDTFAYYQHNHLHTPMQATNKDGHVVWAASYNPFGAAVVITPAATKEKPVITSSLRLPGQYLDEETGLHYNWNRFYDVQTGRYTTADPLGLEGGVNLYAYTSGQPLKYTDANGRFAIAYPIAVGGAIVLAMIWKKMQDKAGTSGQSKGRDSDDDDCTLYRLIDCKGQTVYIGITSRNPKYREREHERSPDGKMNIYGCERCPIKMVVQAVYVTRASCEKAETNYIQVERPFANKRDNPDHALVRYAKYQNWYYERCVPCQ